MVTTLPVQSKSAKGRLSSDHGGPLGCRAGTAEVLVLGLLLETLALALPWGKCWIVDIK